jgi:hypothetical protein
MILLLALTASFGQVLTAVVPPNTPISISWDQPTDMPAQYRWWCDGQIVRNFLTTDLSQVPSSTAGVASLTATVPGLPVGNHSCLVSAYNDAGEAKSTPIPLFVGTLPATPLNLRVNVKVGG